MKLKKCFKWALMTAGILAVIAWVCSSLEEHHNRFRGAIGSRHGFQNGNWMMQQPGLHTQFQHGGFHFIGFLAAVVLWGAVIIAILSMLRKRMAKRRSNVISPQRPAQFDLDQQTSPYGEFLDQWEKNLTNLKEDSNHGNL